MNGYLCYRCRKAPSVGDSTHCDPCRTEAEQEAAAREAFNRGVSCDDCKAAAGNACRTGSGTERGYAHVSREKKARRAAKGAA